MGMSVLASREGYNGETIKITDMAEGSVYVVTDDQRGWLTVSFKMVKDGTFNQSVRNIDVPYVVIGKDVYSISTFHTWKSDNVIEER